MPLNVTQTYTYDSYNRLQMTQEQAGATWSETFQYDNFGNRWVPSYSGITLSPLTVTSDAYSILTNRLTSTNFGYDNAGSQTTISPYTMSYDVENRQTGFTSTMNGSATYSYDGDGRRVTKATGSVTTTYVYDAAGGLAAEYSTQPPPAPCLTCYPTTDHLGSTRVVTDENGNVTSRHDFLPFGEELATSNRTAALSYGVADNVMHKYTGQQRDLEGPGLDFFHARYFHGAQGRFTSPDFSPRPRPTAFALRTDPQTLNLYGYLRNNPLAKIDADGHGDLDTAMRLAAWAASGIAESGPKQFFQDLAVGAAKGTASFGYNTVKTAVALSQGPAGVATAMAPGPKALAPSNQTQAAASFTTQVALTVASAAIPAAGAAAGTEAATAGTLENGVDVGTQLFRVFGGDATAFGNPAGAFFTTVDRSAVADFRAAAGLFPGNTGQFVLEGTLTDGTGVTAGTAAPGPGGVGGTIPEVIVPDAASKINVTRVSGANPPY